jgi:3-hydroxyacyl-[acyl-carrier-protein] dehydratase
MLATQHDIINYIPQRAPMVMIHDLLEATEERAVTQLEVNLENIFVQHGVLSEPGLVENIAQTAAAQVGFVCIQKNIPVPIGYIAAVKDLVFFDLPLINTTIKTTVRVKNQVLDITLIEGEVQHNGKILCRCEMRIFAKIQS